MKKWLSNTSIQSKVNLALLTVLIIIMLVSMLFTVRSERAMVEATQLQNIKDTTDSYLDTLNIMMLTGTLAQFRETHREKVLSQPGITEAKVLRSQPVIDVFGPSPKIDEPSDELDRRALAGEAIEEIRNTPNGRVLTVLRPVFSETNYRGTDCTSCHFNAPEGEQLGAIRLSYSLKALDERINLNLLQLAGIQALLFIAGLVLISLVIFRLIVKPLRYLRRAIQQAEKESDLSVQVHTTRTNDEIGVLSRAFNKMLQRFSSSLTKVATTTASLKTSAETISQVSNATLEAVHSQQAETELVAGAMEQVQSTSKATREFALTTLEASNAANEEAKASNSVAQQSISGIHQLTNSLNNAAEVIKTLDTFSDEVGKVLEIITAIAEQTNLLALNAAIEAARAGESGRGFAVVADEVRSLANRTHEATQEVQRTIENLQTEAKQAVVIMSDASAAATQNLVEVEEVAQSLTQIANTVENISQLNYQMTDAAKEQYEVAGQVNSQVASIGALAQQTSSNAGKSAQVSQDLVTLAGELDKLVASFKLHQ